MKHLATARRTTVVVALGAGLVMAGGMAYGFWSTTGTGNGAAASGSATPLVLTGVSGAGSLVPGGTADVRLLITNNNTANVSISALSFTNTGIAGFTDQTFATPKTGCATTGVTWVATTKTLSPAVVVAGNGGTYTLTLTGGAQMSTASDNGCQTTTFKLPVSAVTATLVSTAASSPTSSSQ